MILTQPTSPTIQTRNLVFSLICTLHSITIGTTNSAASLRMCSAFRHFMTVLKGRQVGGCVQSAYNRMSNTGGTFSHSKIVTKIDVMSSAVMKARRLQCAIIHGREDMLFRRM